MRYYIVDAFADRLFQGNQAGVCILDTLPEDGLMQTIARENNLAETAFVAPEGNAYRLRWFTPAVEIELCGHATLAAAYVLFRYDAPSAAALTFHTLSGVLTVTQGEDGLLVMDFPLRAQVSVPITDTMRQAVAGAKILSAYGGYNLMLELADEDVVRTLAPDLSAIRQLPYHGVIVTAPATDCDFVSRFFAPNVGIDEDPVTGSTHTSLTPYWAARLGKQTLLARQLSSRGGTLLCTLDENRVRIAGRAQLYLVGEIQQANA